MNAIQREKAIASYVLERGDARFNELAEIFGVSRMTIHRHIERLSRQGVVRKLRGSVSAQPSSVYESLFSFRQNRAKKVKKLLATAAFEEINSGEVILIDDSTTATEVAPLLEKKTPLKVVTNSLGLFSKLVTQDNISVLALGGEYHPTYQAFIGHLCENALAGLRVNTLICSTSAVDDGFEAKRWLGFVFAPLWRILHCGKLCKKLLLTPSRSLHNAVHKIAKLPYLSKHFSALL